MTIQSDFGRIGTFEDFGGYEATQSISDATVVRVKDLALVAVSGNTTYINTVDESGGVASFVPGTGDASDGIAIYGAPSIPSSNGTLQMEARFKGSSATDLRVFCGWQETVAAAEPINPFTLNGTTLVSNDGGNVVGFYTDTSANVDDYRFHASLDGTELTTAALGASIDGSTTLGALGIRAVATITADSWVVCRVEIDVAGGAEGWCGAIGMADQNGLSPIARMNSGSLDKDALYFPILQLLAASTGTPTFKVDYFQWKGSRDWNF
jgi:hypothetical protein